jgi:hypothetical protein
MVPAFVIIYSGHQDSKKLAFIDKAMKIKIYDLR